MEKLVFTVPEVAEVLGISVNSAYALVHSDGFPVITVGKRLVIPKNNFLKWLSSAGKKEVESDEQ